MRIIGGKHQRSVISPPAGLPVRPTTDKAKEALFNILTSNFDLEGLQVLDLFSGTGSIAYEFASRGASRVYAVERHVGCVRFIQKIKRELGFHALSCFRADVFRFLKNCTPGFDIVFADPPYGMKGVERLPGIVFDRELLNRGGWLIIEHQAGTQFENHPCFMQVRRYSRVHFSIFSSCQRQI